jgi:SUF system FeS assembly protein, NifU family
MVRWNHLRNRAEGYNPICGDKIELRLNVAGKQIQAIQFESACCAICKASTSMMVDALQGKALEEIGSLRQQVDQYLQGGGEEIGDADALDSELAALSGVSKFPARIKCAQLPWQTLEKALNRGEAD